MSTPSAPSTPPDCGIRGLSVNQQLVNPLIYSVENAFKMCELTVRVVGVETEAIVSAARALLDDEAAYARMAAAVNPYGDGHASERIADAIAAWFAKRQR